MKVAIPVWNDRISPVFDTAGMLLIIDIENGVERSRFEETIGPALLQRRAARIYELGLDVLLCGAISKQLASLVSAAGISIVPFLTGQAEEILAAYLANELNSPRFLMPGCGRCGHRRQRRKGHEF